VWRFNPRVPDHLSFSFTVSGGVAGSIAATWLGSWACGALVTPIRSLPQVLHHLDTPDMYLNFGHFPADCSSEAMISKARACVTECDQKVKAVLAPGRIVTVTRAAKGLEVTRCPFGSFPTAITLIVRCPNGGPYLKAVDM
jgi:hypothetical protein